LKAHLSDWGLRRFDSDAQYFQWQRETLSPADLTRLNQAVQDKQAPTAGAKAEIAFYDLTATPQFVPPLYSQRYDYYVEIGPRVALRLGAAATVLDVGCGIGVLTTWYARQFPDRSFVGVDRSSASVALAAEKAKALGLKNVRFECADLEQDSLVGPFEAVIATHALVQTEQEPGIPSVGWQTFERARDSRQQADFEQRTGIGPRLERLCKVLAPTGRMILFEKTRQLARRVPFQRALAARGLLLAERPELIRYLVVEEIADDGPLYVVAPGGVGQFAWDESPEDDEPVALDLAALAHATGEGEAPLYENHAASAQRAWVQLPSKQVMASFTREEPDGRQLHAEIGTAGGLTYLFVANTFDQRQLVLIEPTRAAVLEGYYGEIERGGG
jgi:SAM-dependent methyltransferase